MATDLFDPTTVDSIVRKIFAERKKIDLSEFDVDPYVIPEDYAVTTISLPSENYGRAIRSNIEPLVGVAESLGYSANIFTVLYEAVKNAHEHGNSRDSQKKVVVGSKITETAAEFVIEDEGGVLESDFIPFVLTHRLAENRGKAFDFYTFADKSRVGDNNGTGTSFMHIYADNVSYFKTPAGGLAVHITMLKK